MKNSKELKRKKAGAYLSSSREEVKPSREKRKTFIVSIKRPSLWERVKDLGQNISPIQYAVIAILALNALAYFILK